jgi:hypothetical protein
MRFRSHDEKAEGWIAFGVAYTDSGNDLNHYFTDAWFKVDGQWVVSPDMLSLMDWTFNRTSEESAASVFYDIEEYKNAKSSAQEEAAARKQALEERMAESRRQWAEEIIEMRKKEAENETSQ